MITSQTHSVMIPPNSASKHGVKLRYLHRALSCPTAKKNVIDNGADSLATHPEQRILLLKT